MVKQKNRKKVRSTTGERVWGLMVYILITLLAVICLYPYLNVMARSFSSAEYVLSGKVMGILPKGFSMDAYKHAEQRSLRAGSKKYHFCHRGRNNSQCHADLLCGICNLKAAFARL